MFILRKIVIGTFSNFVNIQDPGQTKAKAKELVQISKEEAECLVKTTTKKLSTKKQGQNNQTLGSPDTSNNKEELTKKERQQEVTIEQPLEKVVDF